jgi:hypothetical protein
MAKVTSSWVNHGESLNPWDQKTSTWSLQSLKIVTLCRWGQSLWVTGWTTRTHNGPGRRTDVSCDQL